MFEGGIKPAVYSSVASVGGATNHKQTHASSSLFYHPSDSFVLFNAFNTHLHLVEQVMPVLGVHKGHLHPHILFILVGFKGLG